MRVERAFSAVDLQKYGQLSGDTNPVHFNVNFAHKLNFAQPIVHGALINGFVENDVFIDFLIKTSLSARIVSRVIGTMLPGPGSILLYQDLHFSNPCKNIS